MQNLSWKNDSFWVIVKNFLFPFPSSGHVNLGISLQCQIFHQNPCEINSKLLIPYSSLKEHHLSWKDSNFGVILKNFLFPCPSLGHANLGILLKCQIFSLKPLWNPAKLSFPIFYNKIASFELKKWQLWSNCEKFPISIPKFGARQLGNFT